MRTIFLFSFLYIACNSFAQESLSLSQAIEIGLKNNYQIQIAEKDIEIAQKNDDWAIAGRYPAIDFTLNSSNGYRNVNNPASFLIRSSSLSTNFVPGVEASLILFDGYRVRFTKQQLEESTKLSQSNAQVVIENSIRSIILAYYAVLVETEQKKVLAEVLKLSRDRVKYQQVRKEFGQVGTFDVLQTQDAYLNDSTSYLIQANTLENAYRNLLLAMGEDNLSKQYQLTDQLSATTPDYEIEDLKTKMLANNKNLQNLFVNRELAQINTRIQESQRSPTVSLRTGASYNVSLSSGTQTFLGREPADIPEVASKTFDYFLNLSATYNLFDGGARKRNIEIAKVQELSAQLEIENFKRDISVQLENTLATYNNEKRLVELTNDLVTNAQRNLQIADERFKGGLINSFDFRTIQISYINASQSRLNAIFNLKNTETELIRLIGGLVR